MNKQTLIDDYKQTIECLQKESMEKTNCIINLCEKLIEYDTRVKKLEEKLKWYDHYKNSALELKEGEELYTLDEDVVSRLAELSRVLFVDRRNLSEEIPYAKRTLEQF